MLTARVSQAVVMAVNVLLYSTAIVLLGNDHPGLTPDQSQALASTAFEVHANGVYVGQSFFALSLLLLGILARRSGLVPRLLGTLTVVAGLGYLADSLANLVAPTAAGVSGVVVIATAMLGELPLFLWLLIKGVPAADAPAADLHAVEPGSPPGSPTSTRSSTVTLPSGAMTMDA
jgi:hypothetical protein